VQNHLAITLDHAQDRRLFTGQRATPRGTFEPSASPQPTQLRHHIGTTFMSGDNVYLITFDFTAQLHRLFLAITPSRNWLAMT
jgi:hypothetical protein